MLRFILIGAGFLVLFFNWFYQPISAQNQFIIFLLGILLVGIPHGAADLLVASQSASAQKKRFSKLNFFQSYLSRLFLFGVTIYFFPLIGIILFLFFAAYHFGETDLHFLNTNSIIGKLLVTSYGFVILAIIIVNNSNDLQSLIQLSGFKFDSLSLAWIADYSNTVLSIALLFFYINVFIYFVYFKKSSGISANFLIQFAIIVFILYNMPLLLGFSFYFIVWHSIISLDNITNFLKIGDRFSRSTILKQIALYSIIAFTGIVITGAISAIFVTTQAIIIYTFWGLAVLTAPHMQIMHDMYNHIRINRQ